MSALKIKRGNLNLKKLSSTEPFDTKQKAGAVFIEGFANKATVDRGNDFIAPDAWELDNFKKNPIILFNHGFDTLGGTPIGKATQVKPTEDGLFLKVRLSNSEVPAIKAVRNLVEERILQAFSVGFEPKETESMEVGEGDTKQAVNRIVKAELFEVSIVGVPMNQDSLFELSEKSLTTKSLYEIKKEVLEQKGAKFALELHDKIKSMMDAGEDHDEILETLAEAASLDIIEVKDILAGNKEPTEDFKLAVDATFETKQEDEDEEDEEEDEEDKSKENKQGDEEEDEEDGEEEDDEGKGAEEKSADEEDGEGQQKQDFQDCVSSKIPKLLEEGMEQDQAVAAAISQCQEDGKCTIAPEAKAEVFGVCFSAVDKFNDTGEWDFSTLSDTAIFVSTSEPDTKQATPEGEEPQPTEAIKTEVEETDFGSPFLDGQKQTNVLLGALISEIQGLREQMTSLSAQTEVQSEETDLKESDNPSDEGGVEDKNLDYAKKRIETLEEKLKDLGY